MSAWDWPQWLLAFIFTLRLTVSPISWAVNAGSIGVGMARAAGNAFLLAVIIAGGFFA